jgi:hypothetical protein
MSFVGVVGAAKDNSGGVNIGPGIDPVSGRLFFLSPDFGLGLVEGRFFPIPQARTLPSASAKAQERILSDAKTGRVFVLSGVGNDKAPAYTIYKVDAAPAPPPPPDPDQNTTDQAEQDGKTESRFFGSATGYGARAVLANGAAGAVPSPSIGVVSPVAQAISKNINSKCGFTDRELVAGRVAKAQYDTGSTAAEAIAVGIDERTKVDLTKPSRCDVNIRNNGAEYFSGVFATAPGASQFDTGPGWNHGPAGCTSSEGGSAAEADGDDGSDRPLGTAHVSCPLPGGKLEATATSDLTGGVEVGKATTTSTISRDASGVVSKVTSIAKDIDIAGAIQIAEIQAEALSVANGRPKKDGPMSTLTITIKGVTIGGTTVCGENCDLNTVVDELNRAASGRAQFRIANGLDDRLLHGTPKGALTAVQKSAERQASDQALVGDFTTEIPALEMVVYNDNNEWGRARQLYQFAGVATAATYNIAELPPGLALPADSSDSGSSGSQAGMTAAADDGSGTTTADDSVNGGNSAVALGLPTPTASVDSGSGGGILPRVARALARGIRLIFTHPRQALLLLTAWLLFSLPIVLSRRRRLLAMARAA